LLAQKIKDGDYSQAAEATDIREIGTLAESINLMREAIATRESEIRRLAYEDTLTGLPNRIMFNNELNRMTRTAFERGERFRVLLLNLNRFKDINDILGHDAGDDVLRFVAKRLPGVLRETDKVACMGGDEFAVMLPMGSADHLDIVMPRILANLEKPFMVANQLVDITFSIGIANFPEHGMDAGSLIRCADIALNSAKRHRNVYEVYDSNLEASRQEHLHLLGDLRSAVENNELCLYYQPKVQLSTGKTVAAESLIRWRHPVRGYIAPNEFIPFAEHTGIIRMISAWVIENALRQIGVWQARGLQLGLSVNISARDLLNDKLPGMLESQLRENGLAPESICLEITESALMENPVNSQHTVLGLHGMGLEISIDDYGTGYSSLSYVKNLPVDELKIDRAFIMHMDENENDLAIVRSTIDLGHSLGLRVVAEGVETERQYNLLRSLGCDLAQGYYIAKPIIADEFEAWLNGNKPIESLRTLQA
jgi:diguanylate cyclase (GGDEF)-like protein